MKALLPTYLTLCLMISAAVLPAQVRNYTTQQENLPCLNKTFSVVLHIVRDTFGDINVNPADFSDRLAELDTAFAPICAKFQVCETRFIDNFQYDDIENLDEWNELLVKEHLPNRINVFLVSTSMLDIFPQECGYATMNGIAELETGGIVMVKGGCLSSGSKAIQHLFGHYFGLLHTFEGNGSELVDGSNCTTEGDLICDTPADPYDPRNSGPWLDNMNPCRFIYEGVDANSEYYRPDVGNFMSYYEDMCRCGYTHDQYSKMAENFLNSSPRMW